MVGLNVRDNGNVGFQMQKGVIGFAGLRHKWPDRTANADIAAELRDFAADKNGRVKPGGLEHHAEQGRCRCLAVRSRNGDFHAGVRRHQFTEKFRPRNYANFSAPRFQNFRVRFRDRRRRHHQIHVIRKVCRVVLRINFRAARQ